MRLMKSLTNNKGTQSEQTILISIAIAIVFAIYLMVINAYAYLNGYTLSNYEAYNKVKGITMNIKDSSISNTGLSLVIIDKKNKLKYFDDWYVIEKYVKVGWMVIDKINDDEIDLNSNSNQLNMDINWEHSYGELETGKYRIIKRIQIKENDKYKYLYTPFHIE